MDESSFLTPHIRTIRENRTAQSKFYSNFCFSNQRPGLIHTNAVKETVICNHRPTNAILTPGETQGVDACLRDAETRLCGLELEIAEVQKLMDVIQEEHVGLSKKVSGFKASLASHKRLPPEIMAQIFLLCTPETTRMPPLATDFPLLLGHVCSG
jgi:hypothetical protein